MQAMEELKKHIAKFKISKQTLIFLAGLGGILLLAFAKLPEQSAVAASAPVAESVVDTVSYEQNLEQRLEDILGKIAGVGRVQVMVTLQSGYGYEYAKENKVGSDRMENSGGVESQKTQEKSTAEESYVLVDGKGGGKTPIITKELEPNVKGVVVVCDGGNNPTVMTQVIDTVRVAVNLSSTQISVSPMVQNSGIK